MPNFSNISNGESGLSVRNTLNQVIDYVNTGITQDDKYVTGGTYNNSTGTLTLNRPDGSVNVTGFTTGFTETQNLTNVLALGNTTGSNNIVVNNGQSVQSVSGNTKMEFVSDTQLDITSTGNVYISGGTGVELEYYGSPTITSYLLLDNTNNKLHTDDGLNTNEFTQTPTQSSLSVTDGTDTGSVTIQDNNLNLLVNDGTQQGVLDIGKLTANFNLNDNSTTYSNGISNTTTKASIFSDNQSGYVNSIDVNLGTDIVSTSTDGTAVVTQTLTPSSNITIVDNDGTSQIYTQVTQQESEFLVQVEDAISGGSSSFSIQPNYSSWNSDNVPTDERVGLEFDPSGGFGQTRFYKENYVTNESSGIFLNVNQVLTRYVSSAATSNYIDINDFGIDSQSYGTSTQFQSTNGVSSNTFTLAPTSTTLLSTDGTEIFTGTFQGNGSPTTLSYNNGSNFTTSYTQRSVDIELLSSDSNTDVNSKVQVDATNGSSLEVINNTTLNYAVIDVPTENSVILQTYDDTYGDYTSYIELSNNTGLGQMNLFAQDTNGFVRFELDHNQNNNGTNWTSIISGKTSSISLDPQFTLNGNRLYSTDGTYETQISFDPNNLSFTTFDANDGCYFNGTYQTFNAIVDILSTGNVDSIVLDPLNNMSAQGSYISSTSGATTSKLQFTPDLIFLSSTDGVNTPSIEVSPTGIKLKQLQAFDDDADAAAGGLTPDTLYQTTGLGAAPLDVAGILMIKQ